MRTVVYEPQYTGHHFAYLAHLLPALAELTSDVILVTSEIGATSKQFELHLKPHAANFETAPLVGGTWHRGRRAAPKLYRGFRAIVKQLRPENLYVPYGDGIGLGCGLATLLGRKPWPASTSAEVLFLRGSYIRQGSGLYSWIRGQAVLRLLERCPWRVVHHLDPQGVACFASRAKDPSRFDLMPDPVESLPTTSRAAARTEFGIPADGRYLGTAGMIDQRKGVHLLLATFRTALPRLAANDRLLLAGPQADEIAALLAGEYRDLCHSGRIVTVPRHLSTKEMATALAALDLVCTLYPKHLNSASIVIQAAAVERPVLGAAHGWMERTIRQFQLGETCQLDDSEALAAMLPAALERAPGYQTTPAAKAFVRFHSPANFAAHWTARLRKQLGQPPSPHFMPWEDVLKELS